MTATKTSKNPSASPVIYVHAKNCGQLTDGQLQQLLKLGMPICSRLAFGKMVKTNHGYDQQSLLLAELVESFPQRPIVFLRAGLLPSKQQLDQLATLLVNSTGPTVLTLLSNAAATCNPFVGLQAPISKPGYELADLVALLAPGYMHTLAEWTDHFTMLSAQTARQLAASANGGSLFQALGAAGGKLKVADHLYLPDSESEVFKSLNLQPHEALYPPSFGELSTRLQEWFKADIDCLPLSGEAGQAATLHITHSWGGGVAAWLKSFIETDAQNTHYQLRAEEMQSGCGYGQKLSLYAGNELRCPIASWWLRPPIASIVDTHSCYRKILAEICDRHNIKRVFVSSLIGHSLDVLRSGLPTLQILHDHFPSWPLLSINPAPYLQSNGGGLKQALMDHAESLQFTDMDLRGWAQIRLAYVQYLTDFKVSIVAPGQSVLELQGRLEPAFSTLATDVIPHGFPMISKLKPVRPRARKDDRMRMVILGRMQAGKGQQLLARALPELVKHVHVYLLGTGKSGEAFFGQPGVDVILEYDRDELSALLETIGPDFAALLSIVPETFSFTLSELQQLNIPVLATGVGSFLDRIEHGRTGWLIKPDAEALVKQVIELCRSPGQIESIRKTLSDIAVSTPAQMVEAYNSICPVTGDIELFLPLEPGLEQNQSAAADYQRSMAENALQLSLEQKAELDREVALRTEWALDTSKQLQQEQDHNRELQTSLAHLVHVEEQNALILGSASWRITRPLRASRRMFKNFMLARAWNPARWSWLLSQLVRNLSTLGIEGTLRRLQYTGSDAVVAPHPAEDMEPIGDPQPPDAFPKPRQPDVSIVIPVYNQWIYTAACLRSLLDSAEKYSFEVIVVDDQSSDETELRLTQIEGLTYLRNEKNLGFVGSCNRGAQAARGEYLVLLNNDTQVMGGWLDELIGTFETEPMAGLVGARLVYPDGSLQESGGIVFSDGSGWNYGRGADAEDPEYHFLREVDYCSGACIALRTQFFNQIGGFDERYAPAYYEDTDLAFQVRESGFKVLVQPLSAVIHHEGITSGTDTSSGIKKYQLVNQKTFVERWKDQLKSQPGKITNPDDRAALRQASQPHLSGRILFIDAMTPEPDQDSGSVRLTKLMQCCRQMGYGVTFFADNRDYAGHYTRDMQNAGIEVLYRPWLESLHDFFRDRGAEFDYVFISRHYIAVNYVSLLKRYCPDARFIFDTVDLHYLREQRLAELEQSLPLKRTAQQTRRSEMSIIKAADVTVVVSSAEKTVLAKDAADEKVHVISNVHDVPGRGKGFAERKDIFFVGGYQHPPNVDAACWFVKEIWPLIHQQLPNVRFHLIGSKATERISSLHGNGVVFHGFVESLEPFLNDCRLAVAPLRYGAGVKGKVNMSMAHGQPVVGTPAAVEGMFAEHERELLIADDAETFAAEVIRLYQDEDLWYRLSNASIRNVEQHFSVVAARASLTSLFDSFA